MSLVDGELIHLDFFEYKCIIHRGSILVNSVLLSSKYNMNLVTSSPPPGPLQFKFPLLLRTSVVALATSPLPCSALLRRSRLYSLLSAQITPVPCAKPPRTLQLFNKRDTILGILQRQEFVTSWSLYFSEFRI